MDSNIRIYQGLFLIALLALTACAEETSADNKGSEEGALEELDAGKLDSFRSPTQQGEIFAGDEVRASMVDDQIFHAWSFTLEESATITLRTGVSKNLDTVMYLYRRDPGTSRWGRYIKKNDDFQKNIWSQITQKDAKPGEYRVIVKPFKSALRGDFTLAFDCAGAGCPTRKQVACSKKSFASNETTVTQGCLNTLADMLSTPVTTNAPVPECVQEKARALYVEYWDSFLGWEDFAGGESPEDAINIEGRVHGDKGYVLNLDIGADEDGLVFAFNEKGEVLLYVHDEQSPLQNWSCAVDTEQALSTEEQPDESCSLGMLYNMKLDPAQSSASGSSTAEQINEDVPFVVRGIVDYATKNLGVTEDLEVHYEVYKTFRDEAFTARVVFGDPMEADSFAMYGNHSFGQTVDLLHMTLGENNDMMVLCESHRLQ